MSKLRRRASRMDAAFLPVYEGLRGAGIDVLVVKGSVCRSVWPNGALRISSDEDLLVPPEQFAAACALLAEAGLAAVPGADLAKATGAVSQTRRGRSG